MARSATRIGLGLAAIGPAAAGPVATAPADQRRPRRLPRLTRFG